MPFFARPDLSDEQFKQLVGSELTLSGQTRIATTSGLTLSDGAGGYVQITADGAASGVTTGYVLTYDDSGAEPIIKLMESAASGGSAVYTCSSPTTVCVGGLPEGSPIYGSGVTTILECILVPTVNPSCAAFFNSLSIDPSTPLTYEVGCQITICAISSFDRGFATPQYCGTCCYPAGLPSSHVFNNPFGGASVTATTMSLSTYCEFTPVIQYSNNTV